MIELVAQNFDIYEGDGLDKFARTGDVSPYHLLKAGAQGFILGHSEVGDSPEVLNKKILSLSKLKFNRLVVLVGESWNEFEGKTSDEVCNTIKHICEKVFKDVPESLLKGIIIGYEPKWGSRGSGRDDMPPPSADFISCCVMTIRNFIKEKYGDKLKSFYIYGGRSTPERTEQILADRNVDGLILGSACNTVKKTLDIANTMTKVCGSRKKVLICNFKAYELSESYDKYVSELGSLDDGFLIILSPTHTDIYLVKKLI